MKVVNVRKALPLIQQALSIRKKALGEEHFDYTISLNVLAHLYRDLGQYEKALPLYHQALAIRKRTLGEEHPDYAGSLSNLANLYSMMWEFKKHYRYANLP